MTAMPSTAPSWRIIVNTPEAWPTSVAPTALTIAFWAAGIAVDSPTPEMTIGATSSP